LYPDSIDYDDPLSVFKIFILDRDLSTINQKFYSFCVLWNSLNEEIRKNLFERIMPFLREYYLKNEDIRSNFGCNINTEILYADENEAKVFITAVSDFVKRKELREKEFGVIKNSGRYKNNDEYKLKCPLINIEEIGLVKTSKGSLRLTCEFPLIFYSNYSGGKFSLESEDEITDYSEPRSYMTPTLYFTFDLRPAKDAPCVYKVFLKNKNATNI
ncbi:MAG: hypothetical protein KBD31_02005, partial [Proteobacteria bacterium]|nr:hypothetical protein [Pseudomonadota bacterium]